MLEIISNSIRRASKKHICDHCHTEIDVGSKYRSIVTKDGQMWTWKSHLDCHKAAMDFHKLCDLFDDEDVCLIEQLTDEDEAWLAWRHPSVAMRFGFVLTPFF